MEATIRKMQVFVGSGRWSTPPCSFPAFSLCAPHSSISSHSPMGQWQRSPPPPLSTYGPYFDPRAHCQDDSPLGLRIASAHFGGNPRRSQYQRESSISLSNSVRLSHLALPSSPSPCSPLARVIPTKKPYQNLYLQIALGGVLPFGSIFIEMFFVFHAMWQYKYYYVPRSASSHASCLILRRCSASCCWCIRFSSWWWSVLRSYQRTSS